MTLDELEACIRSHKDDGNRYYSMNTDQAWKLVRVAKAVKAFMDEHNEYKLETWEQEYNLEVALEDLEKD